MTDGFSEACTSSGELFGLERTLHVVAGLNDLTADEITRKLRDEVVSFTNGHPHQDDMAALVIKVK